MTDYFKMKLNEITEHSRPILNKALQKEDEYSVACSRVWEHINPKGERIVYGRYGDLIISLGYFHDSGSPYRYLVIQ